MERKVGEIFEYNGEWYQCVEQPKQYDCATVLNYVLLVLLVIANLINVVELIEVTVNL